MSAARPNAHGTPLTDETLADSIASDAVLFGAVGGPAYDDLAFELKPERGLLALRKEMDLFANLRPAIVFPSLVEASTLKPDVVSGLDIMILRELCGGSYFAEPRGIDDLADGTRKGYDTNAYTTPEIERIGRVGMDLARKRGGKLTSVEKSNVMHSGILWRQVMTALHAAEGEGVELGHMYADNCAMQLVRNPKQFDVIVTDNLFGDLGVARRAGSGDRPSQGDVRAGPRVGTGHRRQGHRQPAGPVHELCDAASLQLRPGSRGRPSRGGRRQGAAIDPHRRHHDPGLHRNRHRRHDRGRAGRDGQAGALAPPAM